MSIPLKKYFTKHSLKHILLSIPYLSIRRTPHIVFDPPPPKSISTLHPFQPPTCLLRLLNFPTAKELSVHMTSGDNSCVWGF